ncbi:MAG: diacylglycerol kinase family protein [Chloroflexota bacterium]
MVTEGEKTDKLLVYSPNAGSVTDQVQKRLHEEFADFRFVEFPPPQDYRPMLTEKATVVACGGDGTIASVAKVLAGTQHVYGILAMGTFNNFARALKLPTEFEAALNVVKTGRSRRCTLGKANDEEFLEAAAIGVFGSAIKLGEAAKDLHYGDALANLRAMASESDFAYDITGDVHLEGRATSIIVANTPSIGALIPVGETTPHEHTLELIVTHGRSRLGFFARLLAAILRRRQPAAFESYKIDQIRIETTPPVSVHADTADLGKTPVDISTLPGGLHIILPA